MVGGPGGQNSMWWLVYIGLPPFTSPPQPHPSSPDIYILVPCAPLCYYLGDHLWGSASFGHFVFKFCVVYVDHTTKYFYLFLEPQDLFRSLFPSMIARLCLGLLMNHRLFFFSSETNLKMTFLNQEILNSKSLELRPWS